MTHPKVDEIVAKTDAFLARYPSLSQYDKLEELEKRIGHSKVYIFLFIVLTLGSTIYLVGGAKLISDLLSFLYPAYMSFKAIDSGKATDDTQWLTYWVVFSFLSIAEGLSGGLLMSWIPFYYGLKSVFFIWLYHPRYLGAGLVYTQALRPLIAPYVLKSNAAQKKES
mmetsp:Transcript_2523/g.3320  ORF Transcript_2523/g.3320 Transcript_2523/m.3320 type:complete len:167 (+) Transcript_2523:117-617(+)